MLKSKNFWVGFLAAYVVAWFLPPSTLFRGKKKG